MREKFEYYYVLDPVLGSRPTFYTPYSTGDLDEGALDLNRSEFNETLNDEGSDDKNEGFIPFTSPAPVLGQTRAPISTPTSGLASTQT